MIYRISPTKLNLMIDCERCFYIECVNGICRPQGIMAGVVSKMDSVIKNYFEVYREKGELPPMIEGKVKKRKFSYFLFVA